ncbi:MAG: hypothetical protein ABJE10_17820 [bacterium]
MGDALADARRRLVETRWVHVDGDDADHDAVFHDATGDVPLSRRPKEFLEFSDDGTVRKLATGADDRAHEVDRAIWRVEDGTVVFRFADAEAKGANDYRVVEQGAGRLVIRRQ